MENYTIELKAITLWEPWAWLWGNGIKLNETRSWATKYRGDIAIHAAKKISESAKIWTAATPAIQQALARENLCIEELPIGAVIGLIEIVDCQRVMRIIDEPTQINGIKHRVAILENGERVMGEELEFGDYTPGRWIWITRNPRPFAKPVPARGAQGLWTWRPEGDIEYASSSIQRKVPG